MNINTIYNFIHFIGIIFYRLTLHAVIVILLTLLLGLIVHFATKKETAKTKSLPKTIVHISETPLVDLTSDKTLRSIEEGRSGLHIYL